MSVTDVCLPRGKLQLGQGGEGCIAWHGLVLTRCIRAPLAKRTKYLQCSTRFSYLYRSGCIFIQYIIQYDF